MTIAFDTDKFMHHNFIHSKPLSFKTHRQIKKAGNQIYYNMVIMPN